MAATGCVNPTIEFSSIEVIKEFAITGLGMTLLPAMAVKSEVKSDLLRSLVWRGPEFPVVTQMRW
ncbi:LysR substrate-binding domain-containing protein [Alicyclobacillus kakegawensis]|uniref:LysR substrate-binding domain-containing protein n=1 Tax=Alicyclobacillus kakegawensis TaxID=392012 RepID=UPI00082A163A